VTEPISAAL